LSDRVLGPADVEREGLPEEDRAHPGPRQYIQIAVVLAFVTFLEVLMFYVQHGSLGFTVPRLALILTLIVLMVIKFALVALWYMHLRFDSPIYKRLFLTGLVLALSVFLFVFLMFGVGLVPAVSFVGLAVALLLFLVTRRGKRAYA
jgi:hypothetical protein